MTSISFHRNYIIYFCKLLYLYLLSNHQYLLKNVTSKLLSCIISYYNFRQFSDESGNLCFIWFSYLECQKLILLFLLSYLHKIKYDVIKKNLFILYISTSFYTTFLYIVCFIYILYLDILTAISGMYPISSVK